MSELRQASGATMPSPIMWERFWTPDATVFSWWCAACEHNSRGYGPDEEATAKTDAAEHNATHDNMTQETDPE